MQTTRTFEPLEAFWIDGRYITQICSEYITSRDGIEWVRKDEKPATCDGAIFKFVGGPLSGSVSA